MPLPEPSARREPLHRRTIEIVGYRREDGLFDIEGRLLDRKDVEFPVGGRLKPPGEAVHDMWLRITVDRDLRIVDAHAATDAMPYAGLCDRITPDYAKLIGLSYPGGPELDRKFENITVLHAMSPRRSWRLSSLNSLIMAAYHQAV